MCADELIDGQDVLATQRHLVRRRMLAHVVEPAQQHRPSGHQERHRLLLIRADGVQEGLVGVKTPVFFHLLVDLRGRHPARAANVPPGHVLTAPRRNQAAVTGRMPVA